MKTSKEIKRMIRQIKENALDNDCYSKQSLINHAKIDILEWVLENRRDKE